MHGGKAGVALVYAIWFKMLNNANWNAMHGNFQNVVVFRHWCMYSNFYHGLLYTVQIFIREVFNK